MPELRTDWLTDRSVFVAENRALRPNEFAAIAAARAEACSTRGAAVVAGCPFCAGHESRTPAALYEKFDGQGRWQVRVVANMFPAVEASRSAADLSDAAPAEEASAATTRAAAIGVQEVIIESPRHVDRLSALARPELRSVLEAYADRLRHWRADGRFAYGLVFKNQGPRAGASMAHVHSQFLALPTVPTQVAAELGRAASECHRHGLCAYCRLIQSERSFGSRMVLDRDGYVAFCPFASLQPHEIWLLPAEHRGSFEDEPTEAVERLASVLHGLVARWESLVPGAEYNLLLRTAPWAPAEHEAFHWRLELLPRVTSIAGFEIATGLYINPVAPERAAAQLRAV